MSNVVRNKNLIYLQVEGGKQYVFNINTGEVIGLTGRPLTTTRNKKFSEAVDSLKAYSKEATLIKAFYIMADHLYPKGERAKSLLVIDKLLNIGLYVPSNYLSAYDIKSLTKIDNDWKTFLKWKKDNLNKSFEVDDLEKFIEWVDTEKWYQEYFGNTTTEIPVGQERYQKYIIECLVKSYTPFQTEGSTHMEMLKKIVRLPSFKNLILGGLKFDASSVGHSYFSSSGFISTLTEYLFNCGILGKSYLDFDKDFFRACSEVKQEAYLIKTQRQTEKLQKYQLSQPALTFENDSFVVLIPTTAKEFQQEGERQSNCVYRSYLPEVEAGRCHIVFIRRKNRPEASYITCQVRNDGNIGQCLFAHNRDIKSTNIPELEFKAQYQQHLTQNWIR